MQLVAHQYFWLYNYYSCVISIVSNIIYCSSYCCIVSNVQISSTAVDNVDEEVERISPAEVSDDANGTYTHTHTHIPALMKYHIVQQIILPEDEFDQLRSSSGQSSLECCLILQDYHLTAIPNEWYSEDMMSKMLVTNA